MVMPESLGPLNAGDDGELVMKELGGKFPESPDDSKTVIFIFRLSLE